MIEVDSMFRGKRIVVMGLGLLGRGLLDTIFLARCGAKVTVTDLKTADQLAPSLKRLEGLDIRYCLGRHDPEDFLRADMILRNADVPRASPFLKMAQEHGIPVEMDESLFCKHFKGEVVGITGTRGKTTTSTMIYEILSRHCGRVFLAGNIMGRASLPLLEEATEADTVVLELSSWQLQGFHDAKISPRASVFTNIYPDHLNRYNSMVEYVNDKKAIFLYQGEGDFCVFNGDQSETRTLAQEAPAGTGFFAASDVPDSWRIRIPGAHNGANVAAALCLSRRLEIPEKVIREATEDFSGVEHRLQWLGEYRGIGFVNDSTSTTPVAGSAALSAMQGRRILLIAGGSDKNLDMTDYGRDASVTTARIALLEGSATPKLEDALVKAGGREKIVGRFDNLKAAVYRLVLEAQPGDLILFSPACASFGMFQNEFHRGETFISIVRELFEDDPHGVARDNEP